MSRSKPEYLGKALHARTAADSFATTAALLDAAESPDAWSYALFKKCRTFDEVKALASTHGLFAENEGGRIRLSRKEQFVGRFWLFD